MVLYISLLPCGSISPGRIFLLSNLALSISSIGLRVQVSIDNYMLNVILFKFLSQSGRLEIKVPQPFDENRCLILTFDFVHILKSIRNN